MVTKCYIYLNKQAGFTAFLSVFELFVFTSIKVFKRLILQKAGHACGMTKKGHILINLEKIKGETTLSIVKIYTYSDMYLNYFHDKI